MADKKWMRGSVVNYGTGWMEEWQFASLSLHSMNMMKSVWWVLLYSILLTDLFKWIWSCVNVSQWKTSSWIFLIGNEDLDVWLEGKKKGWKEGKGRRMVRRWKNKALLGCIYKSTIRMNKWMYSSLLYRYVPRQPWERYCIGRYVWINRNEA